jgi:hypothetical protein
LVDNKFEYLNSPEIGGIINEKQIRGAISYKEYFNNEL